MKYVFTWTYTNTLADKGVFGIPLIRNSACFLKFRIHSIRNCPKFRGITRNSVLRNSLNSAEFRDFWSHEILHNFLLLCSFIVKTASRHFFSSSFDFVSWKVKNTNLGSRYHMLKSNKIPVFSCAVSLCTVLKGQVFDLRFSPSEELTWALIHTLQYFRLWLQLQGVIWIWSLTPCRIMQQGVQKIVSWESFNT